MEDFYMVKVIGLYKNSEKSATLNKVHLKAYWADEDGNKIDKGYFGSTIRLYIEEYIIRKSKFPQNPKRSVRFSGKRTKRSVQKRKARNTQKAETKVL